MNSIRPRRAKLLGIITLVLGLLASTVGLAGSASADVPAPVPGTEQAATITIQCDGIVPVVAFTLYNFASTPVELGYGIQANAWHTTTVPAATEAGPSSVSVEVDGYPHFPVIKGIYVTRIGKGSLVPHHDQPNPCYPEVTPENLVVEVLASCHKDGEWPTLRFEVTNHTPVEHTIYLSVNGEERMPGFVQPASGPAGSQATFEWTPEMVYPALLVSVRSGFEGTTIWGPQTIMHPCQDHDAAPGDDGDDADEGAPAEPILPTFDWTVICQSGFAKWQVTWVNTDANNSYEVRHGKDDGSHLWAFGVLPAAQGGPTTLVSDIQVPAEGGVFSNAYVKVDDTIVWGPVELQFGCTPEGDDEPGDEDVPNGGDAPGEEEEPELPASSTSADPEPELPTPIVVTTVVTVDESPTPEVLSSVASTPAAVDAAPTAAAAAVTGTLPRTGVSTIALLALGLAMSLAGAVLLVAGARREAA